MQLPKTRLGGLNRKWESLSRSYGENYIKAQGVEKVALKVQRNSGK